MPPMTHHHHSETPRTAVIVGAIYPVAERGLAADLLAARALGIRGLPVCTTLVMAGRGVVTDLVEVPEDAVRAQLEHVNATAAPAGIKIGVLSTHGAARAVLDFSAKLDGPVILDLQISGPDQETVSSPRAVDVITGSLGIPDVVVMDRIDGELVSGGEIRSLDDAQVAVQRIHHKGARAVLIRCGVLPDRHFQVENGAPGDSEQFATDLFYDGSEFSLFEAPVISPSPAGGAGSAHSMALLDALMRGEDVESALQTAKRYVTEALRHATSLGGEPSLEYFWRQSTAHQ